MKFVLEPLVQKVQQEERNPELEHLLDCLLDHPRLVEPLIEVGVIDAIEV